MITLRTSHHRRSLLPSLRITARSARLRSLALLAGVALAGHAQERVFLNGDSITSGIGASSAAASYPSVLANQLGPGYTVGRDATSGATLLRRGQPSFWNTQGVRNTTEANPDVVAIMLGTNDSKAVNWTYRDEFVGDYLALIDTYRALPSSPEIYPVLPPPAADNGVDVRGSIIANEIIPRILEVARQRNLRVIDAHSPLLDSFPASVPDGIHPNDAGHRAIATQIREAIVAGRGLRPTPADWQRLDVGATGYAGSDAIDDANVLHVLGGGAGPANGADAHRFVFQALNGEGDVTARVLGQRSLDPQAETRPDSVAGVVIRDGAAANARMAAVVTSPGNGVTFRWRDVAGGQVSSVTVNNAGAPLWVRVRRTADTFSGYYSTNGLAWTQIGSGRVILMPSGTFAGVVAAGGPDTGLTRARIDQIQVSGGTVLPPAPVVADSRPFGPRQAWRSAPGAPSYRLRRDSPDSGGPFGP